MGVDEADFLVRSASPFHDLDKFYVRDGPGVTYWRELPIWSTAAGGPPAELGGAPSQQRTAGAAPGTRVRNTSPGGVREYGRGEAPATVIPEAPLTTRRGAAGAAPGQGRGTTPPTSAAAAVAEKVLASKLILRVRTTIDSTVSSSTTNHSNSSVTIV